MFTSVGARCRASIDLTGLKREVTHSMTQPLEDGAGTINLLLTISGTTGSETISDLSTFSRSPQERDTIVRRYVSELGASRKYYYNISKK